MSTRLMTNLNPGYVKDWDVPKAIREIIQNYLDSKSEFQVDGDLVYQDGQAHAWDLGPGLELRHLALGVSEKSASARGKYGEGLKLALLVLAREDREVSIQTKGKRITPRIIWDPSFNTDLLALEVEKADQDFQGTYIAFSCTEEELEKGKSYFVEYAQEDPKFEWVVPGMISLPKGMLYVNGTYVGKLPEALFTYHLDEKLSGNVSNRDREIVNQTKVASYLNVVIPKVKSARVIKSILQELPIGISWEANQLYLSRSIMREEHKLAWLGAFYEVFGKRAVISSGNVTIDKLADYMGFNVVGNLGWNWRGFLEFLNVKNAKEIVKQEHFLGRKLLVGELTHSEQANLNFAIQTVKEFYTDRVYSLDLHETIMVEEEFDNVLGQTVFKDNLIRLSRKALKDPDSALFTLLHEVVHLCSQSVDCTPEFEAALLNVSVNLMLHLKGIRGWQNAWKFSSEPVSLDK